MRDELFFFKSHVGRADYKIICLRIKSGKHVPEVVSIKTKLAITQEDENGLPHNQIRLNLATNNNNNNNVKGGGFQ